MHLPRINSCGKKYSFSHGSSKTEHEKKLKSHNIYIGNMALGRSRLKGQQFLSFQACLRSIHTGKPVLGIVYICFTATSSRFQTLLVNDLDKLNRRFTKEKPSRWAIGSWLRIGFVCVLPYILRVYICT